MKIARKTYGFINAFVKSQGQKLSRKDKIILNWMYDQAFGEKRIGYIWAYDKSYTYFYLDWLLEARPRLKIFFEKLPNEKKEGYFIKYYHLGILQDLLIEFDEFDDEHAGKYCIKYNWNEHLA